ncbi:MAG: hypothetical protein ACSHWQ_09910, partial [Spongiibacteraceae bacterium]
MDNRRLRTLRGLVNLSLYSLLLGAALHFLEGLLGSAYSAAFGLLMLLVIFYCYRRADSVASNSVAYYLWRYLPTLSFVFVPLTIYIYGINPSASVEDLLLILQLCCSYILPVLCLLYSERS